MRNNRRIFLRIVGSWAWLWILFSCGGGGGGTGTSGSGGSPGTPGTPGAPGGPSAPQCSASMTAEPAAKGDYKVLSHQIGVSVGAVAISNRGWRAVAGGQDNKFYYFNRSQSTPQFIYSTGDQVNAVDISRDGKAFVAGSLDGKIYFFECDQTTPSWVYNTAQDIASGTPEVNGVAINEDGRWIGAVSSFHVYLFRRDQTSPVLKLKLSENASLATVAISADGSHLAVGTSPEGNGARVFYLNQQGLLWTYNMADLGWGPNDLPTAVTLSANGNVLAAGGRDNRVHLWNGSTSTPAWTYQIAADSPVFSVALSDDGKRLAATGNFTLYFFDNASTPTYTYDGTYANPSLFGQPVVYAGMNNEEGYFGIGNYLQPVALSADGNYMAAGDYVYGHAFSFYRGFSQPFRMYDLAYDYDGVGHVDLSPDGSWIILGSTSGEILRIEVAPAEIVRVTNPLTYRIIDDNLDQFAEPIGGNQFNVDYWVLKPGRAANLEEKWSLWGLPALGGGVPIPPSLNPCVGTKEWTYPQNLADGNQIVSVTRQLPPPQCFESTISSIDSFILRSELIDKPTSFKLSDDSEILAAVTHGN